MCVEARVGGVFGVKQCKVGLVFCDSLNMEIHRINLSNMLSVYIFSVASRLCEY